MNSKLMLAAGLLVAFGLQSVVQAADVVAGKHRFVVCAGCHGPDGGGNDALKYPRLAGRDVVYIETQLRGFKSGQRVSPTMNAMAAPLGEADIQNLAAYIASLR